jgi:hypothetical protein
MLKRFSPLLGLLALGLVAGCYSQWNEFEGGVDKTFVDDPRYTDLECDATGCFLCEGLDCEEYRCDTTNQCPSGFVCTIDQQCLPGSDGPTLGLDDASPQGSCTAHEDCQSDELCALDGVCVPRNDTAEPGETNPVESPGQETGTAIPLPDHPNDVCVVNADCGEGICLNAACLFACASDGSCPSGQACEAGQCLPLDAGETECTFNGECGPSRLCVEGLCFSTCSEATDCGANEMCQEGLCQADVAPVIQCSGANSCEGDASCVNGKCLATCGDEGTCSEGFSCDFGFCHQEVFCLASAECQDGLACMDGRCQ